MAETTRVRRDIWSLENEQAWHPITRAYALGVAVLQQRPETDPTSWVYQAQIHGMEDGGQPDEFRGQCQHFSWYFLPWHRHYLHRFEEVVLAAIMELDEVDDTTKSTWALPYWNYSDLRAHAKLPSAFLQPAHPDDPNGANPLFVEGRTINNGDPLTALATRTAGALGQPLFSEPFPAGGFGGPATGFSHGGEDPESGFGVLERTPHGSVHVGVGGAMRLFHTAGLDPVFWMHHANIDRLWEVWRGQDDHRNPDETGLWGTKDFAFHDAQGRRVLGRAAGVLDTAGQLGYEYEDITVPAPRPGCDACACPANRPPRNPPSLSARPSTPSS